MTLVLDSLRLSAAPADGDEAVRLADARPWVLTSAELAALEDPPGSGRYPGLASRPWLLVTDQDPEETAMAGESWGTPGTPADTGGRWFDGRAVWKVTFWAEPLAPGVAGSTVGSLPGLGLVVRSHGIAFLAGKGAVEVNGSGFSSTVLADGSVRVFGPENVAADWLHLTVWYVKA